MNEQIFNNRYRIERRLGEGGMAIVYSGTDVLLRRRVAIKVLRPEFAADDDFVRRFYYEAQSAAKLSHPNIVNTYDVGHEEQTYYIVMELVEGTTLAEVIAGESRIPERVAIDYAAQICNGLAYAHRAGILHRDIKPANILITQDDVVKLSDFGIARAVSERSLAVTQPGMVMGSVYYLSPEQAQGHDLDESSDLYSVGVVLFQMLTGKLPYTGTTPVTVALKHVSEPLPDRELAASGVSMGVAAIVRRLLAKSPAERFASASEVASVLREAREKPSPAYRSSAPLDSPTTSIPIVTPPPRRSASPDRPARANGAASHGEPEEEARAPRRGAGTWLTLVVLLAIAVGGGYFVASRLQFPGPLFGHSVTIENYVGESSTQAQQALLSLGITPKITPIQSESIAPDRVVRQVPEGGTTISTTDQVELFVSNGTPMVPVPDVRTFSKADAVRVLAQAKLVPKVETRYGDQPLDSVVEVKPDPQTQVHEGSVVTLFVSEGKPPVVVPNVVSMSLDDATAALKKLGLKLVVGDHQASTNIPENMIAAQDPKDGSKLAPGGAVTVVVSAGADLVPAPSVAGENIRDAVAAVQGAGFQPVFSFTVQSGPAGVVLSQIPAPNQPAKRGSGITLTVSTTGTVPDVSGMSLDDAKSALQNAGYVVGNVALTQEGQPGKVVRTEPVAATQLHPGESVIIYYNQPGQPQ